MDIDVKQVVKHTEAYQNIFGTMARKDLATVQISQRISHAEGPNEQMQQHLEVLDRMANTLPMMLREPGSPLERATQVKVGMMYYDYEAQLFMIPVKELEAHMLSFAEALLQELEVQLKVTSK